MPLPKLGKDGYAAALKPIRSWPREEIMVMKLKAFAIWLAVPYFSYALIVLGLRVFRSDVALGPIFNWKTQLLLLALCLVAAALGTIVLWMLPIRRRLLGVIAGLVLAVVSLVAEVWFAMTFYGGFEPNAGMYVSGLMLLLPSCLAGTYAGFLRVTAEQV